MNTNEHSEREWKVLPLSAEILHLDDELLRAVLVAIRANVRAALATKQPSVEDCIKQLVVALMESKGWLGGYADAIIRDAIDRKHLEQPRAVPAGFTLDQLADACIQAEIPDSKFESLCIALESAAPQPPADTLAVLKQLLEVVEDLQEWDTATQGDIVVYSPEVIDAAHAHIDAVEKRHG